MSKAIVPTARDINEAHRLARTSAETAVEHAIRCGKMLCEKKASLPHGQFEEWVEKQCDFAVSTARKYMSAARQNATGVAFSSLKSLFYKESEKTEGSSKANHSQKKPRTEASASQARKSNRAGVTTESSGESSAASAPSDASVGGSRTEKVNGSNGHATPDPLDDEDWGPDADELAMREATEKEYQAAIDKVMESDDKLSAAHKEIKRLTQLVAHLQLTVNGYQNQHGELVRRYQRLKREHDRLQ